MKHELKTDVTKRCLLHILMMFTIVSVSGQSVRFFPASETISNSLISVIYQDSIGYVWIGTSDGLNRYDGNTVNIYRHERGNKRSLSFNEVLSVCRDAKGHLLVGTRKTGLQQYHYDSNDFTSIPIVKENTGVTQIYTSPDGRTFIITVRYGIWSLTWNGESPIVKPANILPSHVSANQMVADDLGRLWFIGSYNRVYCSVGGAIAIPIKVEGTFSDVRFTHVFVDDHGVVYAGTENHGVYVYDTMTRFMRPRFTNIQKPVSDIAQADGTHLFVATDGGGMKIVDTITGLIQPAFAYLSKSDMSQDKVVSIYRNKQGDLWVGAFHKGFYLCPRINYGFGRLVPSFIKRQTDGNNVTAIASDAEGGVWAAIEGNGLYYFDKNGYQKYHYPYTAGVKGIPSDILSLMLSSDGRLWVGSFIGEVGWIDTASGNFTRLSSFTKAKGIDFTRISGMAEAPDRSIWFCSIGNGLIHYVPSNGQVKQFIPFYKKGVYPVFQFNFLQYVYVDQIGRVFFGDGGGLGCYDSRTGSLTSALGKDRIFNEKSISSIRLDSLGNLWAASNEGLLFYDMHKHIEKHITTSEGLPSDAVCALEIDSYGNVWASTLTGLAKVPPNGKGIMRYYSTDGLQGNEFCKSVSSASPDGMFFFGGVNGITRFIPDNIVHVARKLRVIPSEITVGGVNVTTLTESSGKKIIDRPITDVDHIRLNYRDASFSIGFTTFSYIGSMGITYYFKLDNGRWTPIRRGENHVSFTDLAPGHYKLRVKAVVGDATSAERLINILVSPPWYASWWAYMLYLLIVASAVYLLIRRYRERQQEKLNEMRLRFFTDISHDIRTPMSLIISPLDQLLRDKSLSHEMRSTLQLMYANANRILELINQLLTIRKIDKGHMRLQCREIDIVKYLDQTYERFSEQAKKRNIIFTFEHQMDELLAWVDTDFIGKITDNLLGNALKYTPDGGNITMHLSLGTDSKRQGALTHYWQVDVIDTGKGLDETEIPHLFERFYRSKSSLAAGGTGIGLNLCEMLISRHHGFIGAESRKDAVHGSRFFFQLPLGHSYLLTEEIATNTTLVEAQADENEEESVQLTEKVDELETKHCCGSGCKLLIIDDDIDILEYLSTELGKRYTIITANNGRGGLQIALSRLPDLVISDVMMPDMDGYEFVRRLKHNPNINDIPVILLTAKGDIQDRMEGLNRGADAYIVKPFHLDELNTQIRNLIDNRLRLRGKYTGQQEQVDTVENVEIQSNDDLFMERLMRAVNQHFDDCEYTTERMAQDAGVSRVHLHRKLKELAGVSPGEFIRNLRLKQAARLLLEQHSDITQIAYGCGFSSISVFSTVFKKCYGVSPSVYVKQGGIINKEEKEQTEL